MGFLLFLAALAMVAMMTATRQDIAAARAKLNKRFAWLWIPNALILAMLLFG